MRNVLITSKKREAGTIRDLLRTRAVVGSLMLGVGIGLPVGAYDAIWAKFMSDLGATTLFTSVALTLYALPFILFSTYGGKLADQHGALKVGVIGLGAQVPVVIAYAVFASPAMAMALGAVEATITALALPAAIAAMAKASPQHLAARAQGMHHGTTTIAAGLGAFFMPVIYEGFGALTSFTVLGAVMALAAVFAYAIRPLTTAEAKRLRSRRQLHRLC